jgi:hypothetical protein
MAQEIITYIIIVLAVFISLWKIFAGFFRKTPKGVRRAAKNNIRGSAGKFDCTHCSSDCAFYKNCFRDQQGTMIL